ALVGLLTLLGYALGWNHRVDQLLFHSRLEGNRIALNSAVGFVLLGLALLLLDREPRPGLRPAQFLTLPAALICLLALVGYAYSALSMYRVGVSFPMALNTAIAFSLL